ncbi:MAG: adenosylcobinamide-phosphate synthase CbiB [Pseudomonadota bacterium]
MFDTTLPVLLLAALILDAVIGDPDWMWRRCPHPVVVMGRLIDGFERALNRPSWSAFTHKIAGMGTAIALIGLAVATGLALHLAARWHPALLCLEIGIVAILIAQRSLYSHVADVYEAFNAGGLPAARVSVSKIVGRDPETLDEAGVCRAAIETTAENLSDGVVAPAFWYLIGGLPGLIAYKLANTADSMIGHRTDRYRDFGWAAARLDDLLNLLPARLSAGLIALVAPIMGRSVIATAHIAWRDAHLHKSPNAGWPEAAMAGVLGLALAGPRIYEGVQVDDSWLNPRGRQRATPDDIARCLTVYWASLIAHGALVGLIATFALW